MDEIDFRIWLKNKEINEKVQSDLISRLKKIENATGLELDKQYSVDCCEQLKKVFKKKGENEDMQMLAPVGLPIGKYYISAYKYALSKYIEYKSDTNTLAGKK